MPTAIFGPSSNVKLDFECQNSIFSRISNVKIGFFMSKFDIRPQFECRNGILNVKICIWPVLNAKIGFPMSNAIFSLSSNVKIGF